MASVTQPLGSKVEDEKISTLKRQRPLLISFSGIDGAGKSTQIAKLLTRLRAAGFVVSVLTFWDDVAVFSRFRADVSHKFLHGEGGIGTPENPVNRNDKNVRAWYLTLPRCVLHLLDSVNLRRKLRNVRAKEPDIIVCDRYIFDQLATLPLERPWARAYARLVLKVAPIPDVPYLLDVDPEIARARKPEYPLDFMHQYRASYLRLRDIGGMALINSMSPDAVHDAITSKLEASTGLQLSTSNS
jgi:thymidylate kinase